jgi:DNA-binding PadR family transcriptional regulator
MASMSAAAGHALREQEVPMYEENNEAGGLLHLTEPTRETSRAKHRAAPLTDLAFVILGCVGGYPEGIHGYRLATQLSRVPLRSRALRLGQLYRVLQRLETAGLVKRRLDTTSDSRLRYVYRISKIGESRLNRWLLSVPSESVTADQLLDRLRFADRMPAAQLRALVEEAHRQCERALNDHLRHDHRSREEGSGAGGFEFGEVYRMALRSRLEADQGWLGAVRELIEGRVGADQEPVPYAKASAAL